MPVSEVAGMTVEPEPAYVIPPNEDDLGSRSVTTHGSRKDSRKIRALVDAFLRRWQQSEEVKRSVWCCRGPMGDGAPGMEAIKEAGGILCSV